MVPASDVTSTERVFGPASRPVAPVTATDDLRSLGVAITETDSVPGSR